MVMVREFKYFLAALASICFLLAGCNKYNDVDPSLAGESTLTLNLTLPDIEAGVRSVSGNPNEPATWSAWDRVVDGRYLYRVTAFLIDGDRLVAVEDLNLKGEQKEASLTFNGNFTHGTYRLMVVANYSAHTAEDGPNGDKNYAGLPGFANTVQSIIDANGAIENFNTLYADSFVNYKISSAGGICGRTPQPLTMVKDIELHPGANEIGGELLRTYSRIRIEVENQSDEELVISTLDFSDIFTQTEAYIFNNLGFIDSRRDIDVANENAITPFTATTADPLKIAGKQSAVVFDAYILESRRTSEEEEYCYRMNLGYEGISQYKLGSITAITDTEGLNTGLYLIYNTNAQRYLVAGNNSVETNTLSSLTNGMTISKEYVWSLEKAGTSGNNYYIGTADAMIEGETSYYMNNPTTSSISLADSRSVYYTFARTYTGNNWNRQYYLTMRSSGNGSRYIRVSDNKAIGSSNTNNANYFRLYPVAKSKSSAEFNIPVQSVDNVTGQAAIVEEIKRNDFVNAVVTVSYNKNKGHFTFEVKDWVLAGGNVSFN